MGIHICQSQRLEILAQALLQQSQTQEQSIFQALEAQHFIVPSLAMEHWLKQYIAKAQGISANTHFHQRIQTFQWFAYQQILSNKERVRQANIPRLVMKWRIYSALEQYIQPPQFSLDHAHPLFSIVERIYLSAEQVAEADRPQKKQSMLYWVAEQVSRLFGQYMLYRGHCQHTFSQPCQCPQNWLKQWGNNQALDLEQLSALQSTHAAEQFAQLEKLEAWQRWLWLEIFHDDFVEMQRIDAEFWAILDDPFQRESALAKLPKQIFIFTVLELPPSQLNFLRRLGQYLEIYLFHFNPSQEYWADSVDPNWKKQYDVKVKERFIDSRERQGKQVTDAEIAQFFEQFNLNFNALARESRHPILTRFGKQARDHFSLLANLSSGEEGEWFDLFDEHYPDTLLGRLQSDILYLMEPELHQYPLQGADQSIQIHVCHSALRQLEVLKEQLLNWLAEGSAEQPRRLDDILILTPNLTALEPHIRTVFAPAPKIHGQQQVYLPIKIGGVPQLDVLQAWQALLGRITLVNTRFSFEDFADWLSLVATQQRYALDVDAIARILDLLSQAGFKRGLDAAHLSRSLSTDDTDYRFSFKFALDRLALGIAIPEHVLFEQSLSFAEVFPEDFQLIATLIQIYNDLKQRSTWLSPEPNTPSISVEQWLLLLQQDVFEFQNAGVLALDKVAELLQKYIRMLTLSVFTQKQQQREEVHLAALSLPLTYLLQEIQQQLENNLDQAEPSGQITFSQIGQIRPIPYKLVVMLNLDSGVFPNRQSQTAFDLIQQLRPQLGDRSRLEDDQGAFLDALLLAKQQLWLFYNGFDVNDGMLRQPSSVLQELIDHLDFIVQSYQPEQLISEQIEKNGLSVSKHIQHLFSVHPLQPFDPQGFQQNSIVRFHDHWFNVAQQIVDAEGKRHGWSQSEYELDAQTQIRMNGSQWINQMVFPAELYLKTLGIENLRVHVNDIDQEPLILNGLGRYAVREFLQQQRPATEALLADQLPVGKVGHAAWQQSMLEHDLLWQQLQRYAARPTQLTQQNLSLLPNLSLRIDVPEEVNHTDWVSLNPASANAERRAKVWLEYLLWLVYLNQADVTHHRRIVVFSDCTILYTGLSTAQAKDYLQAWSMAWEYGRQSPLVLPAALLLHPLARDNKDLIWVADDAGHMQLEDSAVLLKQWRAENNFNRQFSAKDDRSTQQHADWRFILQEQDSTAALLKSCQKFGYVLYAPIYQYHQMEKNI
ncbi:exodeoxyribonuclease V subunit gamma [Acinetobacter sp. MD2(2019)]|uniref:exodeoxyribonuclease V subunit gamma n=1 Tax=Acinetobacter sp. MD2(2019) TaxID=2605273 RepID=UPI002D1EEDDC|nr:exodeoxyribonuclease V subunit gamma [Acinetobacter sp. MD2(2019)]MEB3753529.1 exodeoxyribonuclease V subunit gamma [Acinetobacter sp. MD2(2019)]